MQTYLYLNAERTKATYSQLSDSLDTTITKEHSGEAELAGSGGLFALLKLKAKAKGTTKVAVASTITPEQMVIRLCSGLRKAGRLTQLLSKRDWKTVSERCWRQPCHDAALGIWARWICCGVS
jgi:hypothetical protein